MNLPAMPPSTRYPPAGVQETPAIPTRQAFETQCEVGSVG
jgi:hypothetical protein